MKNPLNILVCRNISVLQTIAYVVSLFLGMCILFVGLRFISDIRSATAIVDSDSGFITISKKVEASALFGPTNPATFTKDEVDMLRTIPGVKRIGQFTTATFDVTASVTGAGRGMSTALFLEAVPDSFVDIGGFHYRDGRPVPVIIPADYLTLYNLGFAPARGLPSVTSDMLGVIPVTLSVSGNGRQQTYAARVVGCSKRINTIAVPEEFLKSANAEYGTSTADDEPSRLIIEVGSRQRELRQFLAAHNYDVGGGALSDGRLNALLVIAASMVSGIGLVIMALALFLITVSLHLLLYKTRQIHHTLMILGYDASTLSRRYIIAVATVNLAVTFLSLATTAALRPLWQQPISEMGVAGGGWALTLCVSVVVFAVLTTLNGATIVRLIRDAFLKHA